MAASSPAALAGSSGRPSISISARTALSRAFFIAASSDASIPAGTSRAASAETAALATPLAVAKASAAGVRPSANSAFIAVMAVVASACSRPIFSPAVRAASAMSVSAVAAAFFAVSAAPETACAASSFTGVTRGRTKNTISRVATPSTNRATQTARFFIIVSLPAEQPPQSSKIASPIFGLSQAFSRDSARRRTGFRQFC